MPQSDVGAVASAVTAVTTLVDGILTRADADAPTKELNEDLAKIQNSFADNALDVQWANAYRLFESVGHSLTPGLVGQSGEREFKHHTLVALAELKYLKTILGRINGQRKPQ